MITLKQALEDGRLQDFIAQEEANGVDPVDRGEFDEVLGSDSV